MLAVPGYRIRQMVDSLGKGLSLVEAIGQRHLLPVSIVTMRTRGFRVLSHLHQPTAVKVIAFAGERWVRSHQTYDYNIKSN